METRILTLEQVQNERIRKQMQIHHLRRSVAAQQRAQALKASMHDNAEYQRRKMMPLDTKRKDAIERVANNIRIKEKSLGREISHEQARTQAIQLAKKLGW